MVKRGNAAPIFLRNNFEAVNIIASLRELNTLDLHQVDLEQLDTVQVRRLAPLRIGELRRAAFRERAGWEYPVDEEPFASILLPDVQETRTYSKALTLLARADIKEGRLNDAQDKICITLGLACHVAEPPFAINRLIASANASLAIDTVEELIQHPKSENCYWALYALPRPFIHTRDAIQFESAWIPNTFPEFRNLDALKTETQWADLYQRVYITLLSSANNSNLQPVGSVEYQKLLQKWTLISRARLEDVSSFTSEQIEAMSDNEVSLRYWHVRMENLQTRQLSWALLPYHMSRIRMQEIETEIREEIRDEPLLSAEIFFWRTMIESSVGLEQRIDMLRTVEAIRDWAAKHDGQLPESLSDLELPAPIDCANNQIFQYTRSADRRGATLSASPIGKQGVFHEYDLQVD